MLVKARGTLTVEKPTGPRELFAHRTGPNNCGQRKVQRPLELGSFDGAQPRRDPLDHSEQIGAGRRDPVIERLPALDDPRALDPSDADDPLELDEHLGDPVRTSLVDPRLDTTLRLAQPSPSKNPAA